MISPMLARTLGPKFDRYPCFVQPKLNGVRCLNQLDNFQSRDGKLWHPNKVRHINEEMAQLRLHLPAACHDLIFDGELYVHGWRLGRINGAMAVKSSEATADTLQVQYHIFDVVHPLAPFSTRFLQISNIISALSLRYVKAVPTDHVYDRAMVDTFFHHYTAQGYEGIMLRPDGPYDFGKTDHGTEKRSYFLWKHKQWQDDEFLCIGVTEGVGKADIGIGALVLQANSPEGLICETGPTFKVGTGFDDEERIRYMQNPPIGQLVRVRYLELTADGIPFNPSFIAVL